jgi:hypothetical protein
VLTELIRSFDLQQAVHGAFGAKSPDKTGMGSG